MAARRRFAYCRAGSVCVDAVTGMLRILRSCRACAGWRAHSAALLLAHARLNQALLRRHKHVARAVLLALTTHLAVPYTRASLFVRSLNIFSFLRAAFSFCLSRTLLLSRGARTSRAHRAACAFAFCLHRCASHRLYDITPLSSVAPSRGARVSLALLRMNRVQARFHRQTTACAHTTCPPRHPHPAPFAAAFHGTLAACPVGASSY